MKVHQKGFTVVELVVVISVIAILASIVMVSYSTWRTRIATTEVQDSLTQLSSALKNERNFTNYYPQTVPSSYTPGKSVSITYKANSGGTSYCAKGVSVAKSSVVYYISDANTSPSTAAC